VWNDWGYGMAQLLLLVLAANAVLALAIHRVAPDSGPILLAGQPVSMLSIFCLHCTAGLLLIGLLFGSHLLRLGAGAGSRRGAGHWRCWWYTSSPSRW
jgi:hypothetical protein